MKKYIQHPDRDADHPDFTIRSIPVFQDGVLDSVELLLPVGECATLLLTNHALGFTTDDAVLLDKRLGLLLSGKPAPT